MENLVADAYNHTLKTHHLERLEIRERQKRSRHKGCPNFRDRETYQTLSRHEEDCDLHFRYLRIWKQGLADKRVG